MVLKCYQRGVRMESVDNKTSVRSLRRLVCSVGIDFFCGGWDE